MKNNLDPGREDINIFKKRLQCEEIQELIFAYMTRELGPARSDLVREHLRKCEKCQTVAAETQVMLEMLHSVSRNKTNMPEHLSEKHRARITWAFTHPFLDWMHGHHIVVSLVIAAAILAVIFGVLRHVTLWQQPDDEPWIEVTIGLPGSTNAGGNSSLPISSP